MPLLQQIFCTLRNNMFPRGWASFCALLAKINPKLRNYKAKLKDGDFLYVDLSQKMCMGYFFYGELQHERGIRKVLDYVLPLGGTFIDVGANVGYYLRIASHIVGMKGNVFAFEPMPDAIRLLYKNSEDLSNVKIFNCALGETSAKGVFNISSSGDQSSLLATQHTIKRIEVDIITLDSKISYFDRVDLIKIDVEGYELNVLRGAQNVITKFEPIVLFEYIDRYEKQHYLNFESYLDYFISFKNTNYKLYRVGNIDDLLLPARDLGSDVIAIPESKLKYFDNVQAK